VSAPRKTLDLLASRRIAGSDAATALDTFCLRAGVMLAAETAGMTPVERNAFLVERFGSDAARVAAVLIDGAR
jgi:hypothetical protein